MEPLAAFPHLNEESLPSRGKVSIHSGKESWETGRERREAWRGIQIQRKKDLEGKETSMQENTATLLFETLDLAVQATPPPPGI